MKSSLQRALLHLAYGRPRPTRTPFRAEEIRKVLFIRRNGYGDMICALPLMRSLHAAWPSARIDVLAGERNAPLAEGLDFITKVHRDTRGPGLRRNHYLNLRRLLAPVWQEEYDLAIAIKPGFSPLLAVITHATRIPWRLGYVRSRGHSLDFCYNLRVELPHEREHQIESCLRLLEPLGIRERIMDLSFPIPPAVQNEADAMLDSQGLKGGSWALFNISSERHESRWTPASVASVARDLEARLGLRTLLCGLAPDRVFGEEAARLAGSAVCGPAQPSTIFHFAAMTRRARFLLCADGGPMHIAAAMGAPVFVLFSATDPQIWKPRGIPFDFVQRRRFVADIPPGEVAERLIPWASNLPPRATS